MSHAARLSALLLVAIGGGALRLQFDALTAMMGHPPAVAVLWHQAAYFAPLTALLVTALMAGAAMKRVPPARLMAVATVAIVLSVFLPVPVYSLDGPQPVWLEGAFRAALPVLTVIWWWYFSRRPLAWQNLRLFPLWPAAYGVWMLGRGLATGFWPHARLDPGAVGVTGVILTLAALMLASLAAGAGLILISRRAARI